MTYLLLVLAVLLSFIFVLLFKPKKQQGLRLLLAFSGAFLLALTLFELLPTVYSTTETKTIGVFIMLGILLQVFLESFSKGAEHGHVHIDLNSKFPWLLFLSLSVHALFEGLPVAENNTILYGILVHKIPIAIILGIFLINSKIPLLHSFIFMLFFAFMTPIGTYLAINSDFIGKYHIPLTAIVIGVFLHISTVILFESSEGHKFTVQKLFVILLGVLIAYFL